jgi:hypothetical protein
MAAAEMSHHHAINDAAVFRRMTAPCVMKVSAYLTAAALSDPGFSFGLRQTLSNGVPSVGPRIHACIH